MRRIPRARTAVAAVGALVAVPALVLVPTTPAAGSPYATIAGTFGDDCRDFGAQSSKDISHVELRYVDGRVAKDETTTTPHFAIDGDAGDEIAVAVVKSGRTTETFTCGPGDRDHPPSAVLEIRLSPNCQQPYTSDLGETFHWCADGLSNAQRTVWVDPGDVPIAIGCLPGASECLTLTLRGTGSTDPDGDLATWSIDFGDGTVVAGDWSTTPPAGVDHEYLSYPWCASTYCPISLTVTDAGGRSATDSVHLAFYDNSPD